MDNDLNQIYRQTAAIGRALGAKRVVLYGSRARGDCRTNSDIDLAVFGAPPESYGRFLDALEELPTLLAFDLLYVTENINGALLENIERDGVELMNKFQEKYKNLLSAIQRLEESIGDYERLELDSIRDGVIQRFEFCAELAWKTVREYLLDQGYSGVNSPKSVMKLAYADGLLQEEQGWLALLNARNLTSHLYDEATAQTVFEEVRAVYLPLLKDLAQRLK